MLILGENQWLKEDKTVNVKFFELLLKEGYPELRLKKNADKENGKE